MAAAAAVRRMMKAEAAVMMMMVVAAAAVAIATMMAQMGRPLVPLRKRRKARTLGPALGIGTGRPPSGLAETVCSAQGCG